MNNSRDSKIVADYTNMTVPEAESLDVFSFWGYLHDAWVYNCNQTESGREYLENAYYYSLDKPDKTALRKLFGGGATHGKQ